MSDFTEGQQVKLKDDFIPDIADQMSIDLSHLVGCYGRLEPYTGLGIWEWIIVFWGKNGMEDFGVLESELEAVQP